MTTTSRLVSNATHNFFAQWLILDTFRGSPRHRWIRCAPAITLLTQIMNNLQTNAKVSKPLYLRFQGTHLSMNITIRSPQPLSAILRILTFVSFWCLLRKGSFTNYVYKTRQVGGTKISTFCQRSYHRKCQRRGQVVKKAKILSTQFVNDP